MRSVKDDAARNRQWQKKYLRMAAATVALAKENELDFNLEWLSSLTGVIDWVQKNGHITDPQIRGIVNATRAVKNIVKYKKWKEKKRCATSGSSSSESSSGAP